MSLSKKIPLAMFLTSAFSIYSNTALADHGSMGFGIGTASPIITQTGITLPAGMWAGGLIAQLTGFDTPSDSKLLGLKNNAVNDAHGDVHSLKSLFVPSVFAAYGVTDNWTLGIRLPYVQRFDLRSPNEHGDEILRQGDPGGFGGASLFGQYRFFHSDDNLNHLSLVVALTTPGKSNIQGVGHHGESESLEAHSQPSGGAWNPAVGFSFTRAMGKVSLDSSILYTV
ncbi:MAG: transporter, partial [Candidatus Nitrotoga sp.]